MEYDSSDGEPNLLEQVQKMLIRAKEKANDDCRLEKEAREKEIGELRRQLEKEIAERKRVENELEKEIAERKRVENDLEMLKTEVKGKECKCKSMLDAIYVAGTAIATGGTVIQGSSDGIVGGVVPQRSSDGIVGSVVPQTDVNNNVPATSEYLDSGTTSCIDIESSEQGLLSFTQPESEVTLSGFSPLTSSPMSTGFSPLASSSMSSMSASLLGTKLLSSTSQIYQDIQELDSGLRAKIEPFLRKRHAHANNEKLSDLQRAYFSYSVAKYRHIQSLAERGRQVYKDGVKDKMWKPEAVVERYVKQRVKNKVTSERFKDMDAKQAKRLNKTYT